MSRFTTNYQLHQWDPEDNFLRTDFNTDLSKIDTALAGKADNSDITNLQNRSTASPIQARLPTCKIKSIRKKIRLVPSKARSTHCPAVKRSLSGERIQATE